MPPFVDILGFFPFVINSVIFYKPESRGQILILLYIMLNSVSIYALNALNRLAANMIT